MAKPILSAFADEYKADFDGQIEGLLKFGINNIELRFVDGVNISALTPEALKEAKRKTHRWRWVCARLQFYPSFSL